MSRVISGRMTHRYDGELVVFHIGMQINRPWRPDQWLPVFLAMPRMLRELSIDPESGLLGYSLLFGRGGPYTVQYWSSAAKLYAYAANPSAEHRPAWTRFNKAVRNAPGAVGIWHETFVVARAESIYGSTRPMGLAGATEVVPVERRHDRAEARMADGRTSVPA
jgi:voltage-gated potassium channel Kch